MRIGEYEKSVPLRLNLIREETARRTALWRRVGTEKSSEIKMESHLVIDVKEDETVIALLEDNRLVELQREERNPECALGDIYLGRVRKVRSEINAALVNIGFKQPAFLSYNAMGGSFEASRKLLKKLRSEKGRKGVRQVD